MPNNQAILTPDFTYHIFNRANGNERLFVSDENYRFFLERYKKYVQPIAETFCYCLMPNHFHFLVRVRSEKELLEAFPKFQTLEKLLSKQFSNLFSSYTQAFNKVTGRRGSLFMKNFNRIQVSDEKYLLKLIHYIHFNPVEGGLVAHPQDWQFSSYRAIISKNPTMLKREEVIHWFGDLDNFIHCHKYPPSITGIEDL